MALVAENYFQIENFQSMGNVTTGQVFIWGIGLYVGWATFLVLFLTSIMVWCSACQNEQHDGFHVQFQDEQTHSMDKHQHPNISDRTDAYENPTFI